MTNNIKKKINVEYWVSVIKSFYLEIPDIMFALFKRPFSLNHTTRSVLLKGKDTIYYLELNVSSARYKQENMIPMESCMSTLLNPY